MKNLNRAFISGSIALVAGLALTALVACTNNQHTLVPLQASGQITPPQTMGVQIQNYAPQTGGSYQALFVSNFSVVYYANTLQYSTARDGVPDVVKSALVNTYGFTTASPESAVPGFQDLVLYLSGINLSQQTAVHCAPSQMIAQAGDLLTYNDTRTGGSSQTTLGLRDCDKLFLNLNPKLFDSNANGIPDYVELRCGLNPSNKVQSSLSTSADGMSNLEKCRRNIPISQSSNTSFSQLYAYQYSTTVNSNGTMNLNVNNIPILNGGQDNFLAFYIVETNSTTNTSQIYTAYAIMKAGYAGRILTFPYWATSAANYNNVQVIVP